MYDLGAPADIQFSLQSGFSHSLPIPGSKQVAQIRALPYVYSCTEIAACLCIPCLPS